MDSILTSIKKLLGIDETYTHFDQDIIMHINSVFVILNQLGVGPNEVFAISDKNDLWSDFTKDTNELNMVKTYIYQKVRLMFDPPDRGSLMDALKSSISELEWRLNVQVDPREN